MIQREKGQQISFYTDIRNRETPIKSKSISYLQFLLLQFLQLLGSLVAVNLVLITVK